MTRAAVLLVIAMACVGCCPRPELYPLPVNLARTRATICPPAQYLVIEDCGVSFPSDGSPHLTSGRLKLYPTLDEAIASIQGEWSVAGVYEVTREIPLRRVEHETKETTADDPSTLTFSRVEWSVR